MIKLSEWDRLYVHNFDWALRMLESGEHREDWLEAILVFNTFQTDLFSNYGITYNSGNKYKKQCIKGLALTSDALFKITHKYISSVKNYIPKMFIFHWWNDLRHYVPGALPKLDCAYDYCVAATKEEIVKARKDFGIVVDKLGDEELEHTHTFKDDAQVLEYRGNRYIIDNEWSNAWTKDKHGSVKSFRLDWDWWFPIDEYLDLEE